MNLEGISKFNQARIEWAIRLRYSPMPELDMGILASQLNAMRIGELRVVGKTFETMMERDAELGVNADKRYEDIAGQEWKVVSDGSLVGDKHAAALTYFYQRMKATSALEQDVTGKCDQLISQVASAHSYYYSCHEMLLRVDNPAAREVTAEFRHTPVWFFESRRGYLAYLQHIFDMYGQPCIEGEWLTAVGKGWMRPLSMAFAMKHFPLRDWLLFCTRYGSGFLEGITDAQKDSPEWDQAIEALDAIANDGVALHNRGVEFKFLEQAAKNALPFQPIVEMINGLYAKCYRGVDLATGSRASGGKEGGEAKNPVGASVQSEESGIFLVRDCKWITGIFNERIDRPVIRYLFNQEPRAWFALMPPAQDTSAEDLQAIGTLVPMGLRIALKEVYERFRWKPPLPEEPCLEAPKPVAPTMPGEPGEPGKEQGAGARPPEQEQETEAGAGAPDKSKEQGARSKEQGTEAGKDAGAPRDADDPNKPKQDDGKTMPAQGDEDTPIAPGADPDRQPQTAAPGMPDTQVDAGAFWSRAGLAPRGADGQTLPQPSLGYALPNTQPGEHQSAVARKAKEEIARALAGVQPQVEAALLKVLQDAFLQGLDPNRARVTQVDHKNV